MDSSQLFTSSPNPVIPILCGTFTSIYLYILQFSTLSRTLSIQSRLPAHGAHQYLALSPGRDTLYATSWAWPPALYSFRVGTAPAGEEEGEVVELTYQGKTPISESSSLPNYCF
jgi:carboxy-cis,cis-muconate cyclase